MTSPKCFRCCKTPSELEEYASRFIEESGYFESVDDLVRRDEGTFNPATNTFACTECYIEIGMPTAPRGWKAPASESSYYAELIGFNEKTGTFE